MVRGLDTIVAGVPGEQAEVVARFAKWLVMRRLRVAAGRGRLTRGAIQGGRSTVNTTVRFLGWLTTNGLTLPALTQSDLDRYLNKQPDAAATSSSSSPGPNAPPHHRAGHPTAPAGPDQPGPCPRVTDGGRSNCSCTTKLSASTPAWPDC